jgi:four helix bundle protein
MNHLPIEETDVFKLFDALSDEVWDDAIKWTGFAQDILGKQLLRALDSVGANLVEGDGRYSDGDAINFFMYSRGSARESQFWLRKVKKRGLIKAPVIDKYIDRAELGLKMLNSLINYRRRTKNQGVVRELEAEYFPNAQRLTPNAENAPSSHGGDSIL